MHLTFRAMRRRSAGAVAALALSLAVPSAAHAVVTTINGLDYDLDQFTGAAVTTNVSTSSLFGSTFDNPNGIDGFTLGELAAGHFGGDFGDRITLGIAGAQDSLTLTYGAPVLIGPGDSSLFVVFEQSGETTLDPEGQSFEISFNGGSFISATSASVAATGGVVGAGGTAQNQIVFDLLHADFGFAIGDALTSVTIRNFGSGGSEDDPDFLFAGRAGTAAVFATVSEPVMLALFGLGLVGLGLTLRRR